MKFKKTIATILSLAMFGATAGAADIRVSVDGTNVTIQAQTERNVKANIIVSRKGEDINDNANIYEMIQVKANAEGKIIHTFILPEERDDVSSYGEYDVFVKPFGKDVLTGEFSFVTVGDIENLMIALKADGADFGAIFAPESEYRVALKSIGCTMSKYDTLENPENAAIHFAGAFTQDADKNDVKNILSSAILVESVKDAETADVALSAYSPKFDGKEYVDMKEDQQEWVAETIPSYAPFTSVADFETKYELANILYVINNTKFDKLAETLGGYAAKLGIENNDDYKGYKQLGLSKQIDASEDIAADLKNTPVKTVSDLCDIIGDAVTAARKKVQGGGSGSSGGGSGIGIIAPGPAEITPIEKPDAENTKFTDLALTPWAETAILALRDQGIVSGKGNGLFAPQDTVTREEFTTMIVKAAGLYLPGETADFDDIAPTDWCYSYVASAFNNKLIYGVSATSFGKGQNISRQDMAVIAYRAAKDSGRIHSGRVMEYFKDQNAISEYALEAIEALYKAGVVNGSDGYYNPNATATRAEASVIIYNLFVK